MREYSGLPELNEGIRNGNILVSNSDKVDGFHASTTPSANTIPVANDDGSLKDWITDSELLEKIKNVDGENSGLDADLVRGLPADFTCNKNQSGYTKLPNGLIIQWGQQGADATVIFPIAFPNAVFCVVACSYVNGYYAYIYNDDVSTIQFKLRRHNYNGNSAAGKGYWIAIGY